MPGYDTDLMPRAAGNAAPSDVRLLAEARVNGTTKEAAGGPSASANLEGYRTWL